MSAAETAIQPVTLEALLVQVKANLILEHDQDDLLLTEMVASAISYATSFQPLPEDHYQGQVDIATGKEVRRTIRPARAGLTKF